VDRTADEKIHRERAVTIAVIPAFNESQSIGGLIEKASKYVTSIIVVDDGSHDKTAEIASSLNAKVIRLGRNMGKGIALKYGIKECMKYDPDFIIMLDGDGQHDPEDIPKVLAPLAEGNADIVIGSRYGVNSLTDIPVIRGIGLSIIELVNRSLTRTSVRDTQSGFRAYSKNTFGIMSKYISRGYGAETELLSVAELQGYRVKEVPVTIRYRGLQNTSKENQFLHGASILSTIFRITVERRPLLSFGLPGTVLIAAAIISMLELLYYFNGTRYFSLPLALLTLGFMLLGSLLILGSLVFYVLKRIREE
jgi:glycosyltransferase involved in cell wall biosynthesis